MGTTNGFRNVLSGVITGGVAGVAASLTLYVMGVFFLSSWATLSSQVEETNTSLLGVGFHFKRQEPLQDDGSLVLNLNGEAKTMRAGDKMSWPALDPQFEITLVEIENGSTKGAWIARFRIERQLW